MADCLRQAFLGFDETLTQDDIVKELKILAGDDDGDDEDDESMKLSELNFQSFTKQQDFGRDKIESICRQKLSVATMMIFLCDRVENTVGKEENAGYQHFLLFLQHFPKPSSLFSSSPRENILGSLKVGILL